MTNQLDYLKAKRRIMEVFVPGFDSAVSAKSLSDEEMEAILDAVTGSLPFRKPAQMLALSMFLFEGVKRFDRWFSPSPYVVPLNQHERFAKFVNAFWRIERDEPMNCPVFKLHLIKDLVFKQFDEKPIDAIAPSEVLQFQHQVEKISAPTSSVKMTEFIQQKSELLFVLNGLIDRSLRTIFRFRIPYVLHKQPLEVEFTWCGVPMRALVTPSFRATEESFIQTGDNAALSAGASRWQTGSSVITIEREGLVDGSAFTDRLQAVPGSEFPVNGWPKSFTLAFSIFHDLAWRLRTDHAGHQDWIPAPRDLSDLEFWIKTSSNDSLGYIRKGSPAALLEIFTPTENSLNIVLGELTRLPWSAECRVRANMYLELGDTNEALFWLNVAVESLITQRFQEIEVALGRPGLAADLGSPREFWSEAEAILSKQFPDMTGKVIWPSAPIHVSIFGKLKSLYRLVPMKTSAGELTRKYQVVSGERNDLFHGKRTSRVTVATVEAASQALSWIDTNMWPEPPSDSIG
ncbi:hypothetical protein [Pseudomonas izuensis]|uniref:Apea-like HEPN domain-containing protein n=1 Tax=Pseudomonas izuensis TaxID=2684212 RepID=A0ABM7RPG9_9PSED|nr:hypothetical protein [Pseudomonas izuensis]BCX67123.1 hypothetical protein LAB08_R17470 [Pseudomonas izuensis]